MVNDKRVERIWRREGLKVPEKQPRRGRLWLADGSCLRLRAERPDHVWSYDFVEDRTHCPPAAGNPSRRAEGRSDAVLGNPVTAVAWLARKVASFGVRLQAGHVILPGSVHRAIDAAAGDEFRAEFDGLGSVELAFK